MTDSDGTPEPARRRHVVRLALFVAFLVGLFYLFAVAGSSTSTTSAPRSRPRARSRR
jgi:hypothetical protein